MSYPYDPPLLVFPEPEEGEGPRLASSQGTTTKTGW